MTGRWPANVILSPGTAEVLDEQSGITKSRNHVRNNTFSGANTIGMGLKPVAAESPHTDEGGASRFFLTAGYEPWELEWIIANGLTPCGE